MQHGIKKNMHMVQMMSSTSKTILFLVSDRYYHLHKTDNFFKIQRQKAMLDYSVLSRLLDRSLKVDFFREDCRYTVKLIRSSVKNYHYLYYTLYKIVLENNLAIQNNL